MERVIPKKLGREEGEKGADWTWKERKIRWLEEIAREEEKRHVFERRVLKKI